MFIPTWLVVVVAVLLVTSLWPSVGSMFGTLARVAWSLLVIVSIPLSLYLFSQGESGGAWIAAIPWLIVVARVALRGAFHTVRTSLWWHETRVLSVLGNPQKVQWLRLGFADAIGLEEKVAQFYKDVRHFPSSDGTAWASNVIARHDITELENDEQLKNAGVDPTLVDGSGPCLMYVFHADDKDYAFCSRRSRHRRHWHEDEENDNGYPLDEQMAWVVEKPDRLVLALSLRYSFDESSDAFHDGTVHTFKPGPWLSALLNIAERVRADESDKHKQWRKQWEHEHAERNFL